MSWGSTLMGLLALAMLVGAIVLQVRFIPRWAARRQGAGHLRVRSRLGVAPRAGVVVVQVGARAILLGVGEDGVRYLTDVTDDLPQDSPANVWPEPASAGDASAARPSFRAHWERVMRRGAMSVLCAFTLGSVGAQPALAQRPVFPAQERSEPKSEPQRAGLVPPVAAPTVAPPQINFTVGQGSDGLRLSGSVGVALFLGALTLLPSFVLVMTSFLRIVVVLGFLRSALGTQTSPPTQLLIILALVMTGIVMQPTLTEVTNEAITPYLNGQVDQVAAYERGIVPLRRFMLANVRPQDVALFAELGRVTPGTPPESLPLATIVGAFMTSELRTAFLMGFLLYLPFMVVDLLVASSLMSLGMFMLPPVMVSLPFKLLLFVMADGWTLLVKSLVMSFKAG